MFKFISALSGVALLSACASQPEDIQATYVSPNIYGGYTCPELFAERERIVARVNSVTDAQADKATNDAVATGVGIILFWPALFLLASGSDREAELASLKGNYDAIEQAIIQRKCQLESPSEAAARVAAAQGAVTPTTATIDSSFEAQQRSINGETADVAAPVAMVAPEPQPVAVAAAQPMPAPTVTVKPTPTATAAPSQPVAPTATAPAPSQPAAPPQPVAAAPRLIVQPAAAAPKPQPAAAVEASPSIPASLYADPNLAKPVEYTRAEIREYCGQAWRIRDLTDGTFEINPCYDRRYN